MYIPFNQLPPTARVWIYQSKNIFTENELKIIESELQKFSHSWDSHGSSLKNSYSIFHNRFIVISVDESMNNASGCSIDKSVNLMKLLSEQLNVDLLDKTQIAFVKSDESISTFDFKETKEMYLNNKIDSNTIVFNNLVSNIADFQSNWQTEISNTWLKKYI